jgi:hypothetical protein
LELHHKKNQRTIHSNGFKTPPLNSALDRNPIAPGQAAFRPVGLKKYDLIFA